MHAFPGQAMDVERELAEIWAEALNIPVSKIGPNDHLFSLGGDSLLVTRVMSAVNERFFADRPDDALAVTDFFTHGTIMSLAARVMSARAAAGVPHAPAPLPDGACIAIIGMACRFPGAPDIATFWRNLRDGVESIRPLSESELRAAGVTDVELGRPRYVRAAAFVEGVQLFDASYFGLTAREAAQLGPELRLLIECSEEALQDAGYGARAGGNNTGVFVGTGVSSYLLERLGGGPAAFESAQAMALLASNTSAASYVSYLLDLTGPGVTVDTACSSSLVAVHCACRALLSGECDMALAGGATVRRFNAQGYYAEEGGIFSPDGHCRPFDQAAQGTVSASGAGIVLLKPLSAAIADGDPIHAIIRGTAINNDGGSRAGYTAPSTAGQASAIRRALATAKVTPTDIQYLETHGTATALGDVIEIAALSQVFTEADPHRKQFTLGTLKANVGHLEAAAGIAGLIKVALALKHREMPPSIPFDRAAQALGLEKTPFELNRSLRPWPATSTRRLAGVSSFGIGGTNAHAILEEPVSTPRVSSPRPAQLLPLSARTETALRESSRRLALRLAADRGLPLADVAYTLQTGRAPLACRNFVVASNADEAIRDLELLNRSNEPVLPVSSGGPPPIVFLFPGQGSQYPEMACGIYASEPVFREHLDECSRLLRFHIGKDLQDVLAVPAETLAQTRWCQPALFAVEYSLARLWQSWGVMPSLMIGHSLGEYVAACLSGVFTLEDALTLVAARGRLMQDAPAGRMLAVRSSAAGVAPFLHSGCSLAAINGPASCVISGPAFAIGEIEESLARSGIACRVLSSPHAFHSAAMDGVAEELRAVLRSIRWGEARIPFISNLTGEPVAGTAASSAEYWSHHLRETVDFSDGLLKAMQGGPKIFLEVGPDQVLGGLVRGMPGSHLHTVVASTRRAAVSASDSHMLMHAAGRLWQRGVSLDWRAFHAGHSPRRVSLPAHPFERQRHWIDSVARREAPEPQAKPTDLADWFHIPVWNERPRLPSSAPASGRCVLVAGDENLERQLARELESRGVRMLWVPASDERAFTQALSAIEDQGLTVSAVVYGAGPRPASCEFPDERRLRDIYNVAELCKALVNERRRSLALTVVTHSAQALASSETPDPCGAMLSAAAGVISAELPEVACRNVDVVCSTIQDGSEVEWLDALVDEILSPVEDVLVVLRGRSRWVRRFQPLPLQSPQNVPLLRAGGVYLVTGGLGGIGWTLAEFLARTMRAKLILAGRRDFPVRAAWEQYLQTRHPTDPVCEKIRAILAWEEAGAQVRVECADVSRAEQAEAVIARVRSEFGGLHGVIHAAGVPGGGALFLKAREAISQVMAPKVAGTWWLHEACKPLQPDFFLCCSSLASIVSPPGQYEYCAANAYQDAFCRALDGRGRTRFVSIDWDAWRSVGMAVDRRGRQLAEGISCEQGAEVFRRVLANPLPQWIVNVRGRLGVERTNASREFDGAPAAAVPPGRGPQTTVRSEVAALWTELLGVSARNDEDDFFTLGGDSLLAVQLRSRLEQHFGRNVPLKVLVSHSTLGAMTRLVEEVPA